MPNTPQRKERRLGGRILPWIWSLCLSGLGAHELHYRSFRLFIIHALIKECIHLDGWISTSTLRSTLLGWTLENCRSQLMELEPQWTGILCSDVRCRIQSHSAMFKLCLWPAILSEKKWDATLSAFQLTFIYVAHHPEDHTTLTFWIHETFWNFW